MADQGSERIAIEVTDKVASSVSNKLRGIADQARRAYDQVTRLQSQLDKLNVNNLAKYQQSMDRASAATTRQNLASERLATQQARTAAATARAEAAQARAAMTSDKAGVSAARLAIAEEKLATQRARTAAQMDRNAAGAARLALAEEKVATQRARTLKGASDALTAEQRLQQSQSRTVEAANRAETSQERLKAANNATAASAARLSTSQNNQQASLARLAATQNRVAASAVGVTTQQQKLATATQQTAAASTKAQTAAVQQQTAQNRQAAQVVAAQNAQTIAQNNIAASASRAQAAALRLQQMQAKAAQGANAVSGAQQNLNRNLTSGGLTWKMYQNSLRGVPAQITDIVVSLQGGQAPLTVLLQQGGQLKDMFGGVVPAVKALTGVFLGMLTPVWLTVGAFGALAFAMFKSEQQTRTLNSQLAQLAATGRTDITPQGLIDLRKQLVEMPGVSKSTANAIISEFTMVRSVGGKQLSEAAKIVGDLGVAMGTDTTKAAKFLAEALDKPLQGAKKLDEQIGFLTGSQFKMIESLTKAGKTAQAQQVILDALSLAIKGLQEESLTPLQKASNEMGIAWERLKESFNDTGAMTTAIGALAKLINGVAWLIEGLNKLSNWTPPKWMQGDSDVARKIGMTNPLDAGKDMKNMTEADAANRFRKRAVPASARLATDKKWKDAGIGKEDKSAEKRAVTMAKLNLQLNNEIELLGKVGEEREKQEKFDHIEEMLTGKKIKLNDQERASIKAKIDTIIEGKKFQQQLDRIYEESNGPLRDYNNLQLAAKKLLDEGKISQRDYNRQLVMGFEAYANFNDPLREYNKQLQDQAKLTKYVGDALDVETQVQQIENSLLEKGIALRGDELALLRAQLGQLQTLKQVQEAYNTIWNETIGAQKQQAINVAATNRAYQDGILSLEQYKIKMAELNVQQANLNMNNGVGTFADVAIAALGRVNESYKGVLQGLGTSFGDFFSSITDGFANSVGRAIVYSEDLGSALRSVAQEALSSLISALVKLGIQYVVNAALGQSIAASATAASVAQAAAIAGAWAPAAAAVSLATMGENSIPAMAGITATNALSKALSSLPGYMGGGWTGNGPRNQVAGVVHGQETVMNAQVSARNRDLLSMIASGDISQESLMQSRSSRGGTNMNVSIKNYAGGVEFETRQLSENDVEVIARKVARKESDNATSRNLSNPNSRTSKTLQRTTKTVRNFG